MHYKKSTVLTKVYPAAEESASDYIAIIVRCFDRRFRIAHSRLITEDLCLKPGTYWPPKSAGGVAPLARSTQMRAKFYALMDDIETAMRHSPNLRHIILIGHQDCRKYDVLVDRKTCGPDPEKRDVGKAMRMLARKYPKLEISGYFAFFADLSHKHIRFEAIGQLCSLHKLEAETLAQPA